MWYNSDPICGGISKLKAGLEQLLAGRRPLFVHPIIYFLKLIHVHAFCIVINLSLSYCVP